MQPLSILSEDALPLTGIRILDLTRVLAGPHCSMLLGDLGAEVLKIEHPIRGDDTRNWGIKISDDDSTYFRCANRNKRSITVNIKETEGRDIIYELTSKCDVVLHNFKFDDVERFGLNYEKLKNIRKDIIYCSISGYSSLGLEAKRPGYDLIVQGEAGLMSFNGEPNRPPVRFGIPLVDITTGMYSAQAILAALIRRMRSGRGAHIELSLFECGLSLTGYFGLEALLTRSNPPRFGNSHPTIVPYGIYESSDGPIIIAIGTDAQYRRLCEEVIDRPDLADDIRFKTNQGRVLHKDILLAELINEFCARPSDLLIKRLLEAGIPSGRVNGLFDALTSTRTIDSEMIFEMNSSVDKTGQIFNSPYRFETKHLPVRYMPPTLGEATDEVLSTFLGMSAEYIIDLRERGVI